MVKVKIVPAEKIFSGQYCIPCAGAYDIRFHSIPYDYGLLGGKEYPQEVDVVNFLGPDKFEQFAGWFRSQAEEAGVESSAPLTSGDEWVINCLAQNLRLLSGARLAADNEGQWPHAEDDCLLAVVFNEAGEVDFFISFRLMMERRVSRQ